MHPVVIEVFVFAFLVIFAVTQVILPAVTNTTLFPSFRFKRHHRKVADAKAAVEAAELEAAAVIERQRADHIHQMTRSLKKEAETPCSAAPASPEPSASSPPSSFS